MKLHVEQSGQGPDVVLVHGWGLHGGIWSDVAARLTRRCRVTVPDLPGHGQSPYARCTLDELARALLAAVPHSAIWVGWSLGALVTLAAARQRPDAVAGVVLVGATPRFVAADDWAHAVTADVFLEFAEGLEAEYERTLTRFLSLQFGAGDAERVALRHARQQLYARGRPSTAALRDGLSFLQTTDLRAALADIGARALVIHGADDRLAPPPAGAFLARALPQARYHLFPDTGHAPFISQVDRFMELVEPFVHG